MALVSATLVYNVLEEEVEPVFTLEVQWTQRERGGEWDCRFSVFDGTQQRQRPTLAGEEPALLARRRRHIPPEWLLRTVGDFAPTKYAGYAGMLLADIGVFTGFKTVDVERRLRSSRGGAAVKRVEVGPHNNVLVYLSGEVEDLHFQAVEIFLHAVIASADFQCCFACAKIVRIYASRSLSF